VLDAALAFFVSSVVAIDQRTSELVLRAGEGDCLAILGQMVVRPWSGGDLGSMAKASKAEKTLLKIMRGLASSSVEGAGSSQTVRLPGVTLG
jgi:hypothetical protein